MKFLGNIDTTDIILLDVKYAKGNYESDDQRDYAMVLLKNLTTKRKYVVNIPEPEMEIYFVKPNERNFDYAMSAIERSRLVPKRVKYRDVLKEIAQEAGGEWAQYRKQCIEQKQFRALKNLYHYPYTFGSDLDIRDYYRCQWNIEYYHPEVRAKLHKAFLDIEADTVEYVGMPPKGSIPINAISVADGQEKIMHTFLLRNAVRPNPQIAEFEKDIDDFYKLCHETFDEEFPGYQYKIYMFDTEPEMLTTLFQVIRQMDADFLGIWNSDYDIPNIMARAETLGMDVVKLMCDPSYKKDMLYYWEDERTGLPVEKKSYFDYTSKTIWTDMMKNYGKIRKGRGVLRSAKLNAIAEKEIGSSKLDYHGGYDKNLPYTNYKKFVLYNIKDVLLLDKIESKTNDMDNLYSRSIVNGSMFKSVFSQTKFLKNRYYIECYKDGYVCGNNVNMDYAKDYADDGDREQKFDGAVVGDPELNGHVGEKIFGKRSKYVFRHIIDEDFSSMYPNSIISYNVGVQPMIGKLIIDKGYYKGDFKDDYEEDPNLKFETGKEFNENFLTEDSIRMGRNWFGLPSMEKMLNELDEKYPMTKKKLKVGKDYGVIQEETVVKVKE